MHAEDTEVQDGEVRADEDFNAASTSARITPDQCDPREIGIIRRQAELTERELALARREIEMLREMQRMSLCGSDQPTAAVNEVRASQPKINISAIADLLDYYNGNSESYERWEKQVRLLKATYNLEDNQVKVLMGSRLRGKASEWFHSKPEFIEMPCEEFLVHLKSMFFHRLSKVSLRKKFEERVWRKGELFSQYFHDKIILANRVPIDADEMVDYVIDGIPDASFRDQARIQRIATTTSLLEAFEKVTLRGGSEFCGATRDNNGRRFNNIIDNGNTSASQSVVKRRCRFCGAFGHQSPECPTKDKGMKCFECQGFGHVSANCPTKRKPAKETCSVTRSACGKYYKEVLLNGHKTRALIDTGSDLCLIRADEYIKLGAPQMQKREIHFRGVGSNENVTLGEFSACIVIDGNAFPIVIRVVSDNVMQHELLIGTDFLNAVELTVKEGKISIAKTSSIIQDTDITSEILHPDFDCEVNKIDVSYVANMEHRYKIENMVEMYKPVRNRDVNIKMNIVVKDDEPVYQRARRLSPSEREEVGMHVECWLREGIVQPSLSEYASPVVLVKKKNGTTRLCIDYRQINKKITKDRYPLPLIEDQLDLLQDAKIFSTLDLKNGFFHVSLDENSRKYTAFIIPDGQYEFLKVPFGLCNSPAVFQKFINAVFKELIAQKTVMTYMDDLIIPSTDCESGLERLKIVLKTAADFGLVINWEKCRFLQSRIEYLGHVIENGSIHPSERKTDAVMRFPEPNNFKQIQSFLGLTGYFRKFVAGYSLIARPLTNLLRASVKFRFAEEERFAFNHLKNVLSSNPVLRLYKLGRETELHTDASMYGYGDILLQRDSEDRALHPAYYASGKTTVAEEKYSSYELEVLAIIKALKKFRVYLLGIPFRIITDCRAFMLTMNKKDLCVRVARWALHLEEFDYTIEHRPSKSMNHVDALSRNPLPCVFAIDESEEGLVARLRKAQRDDKELKRLIELLEHKAIDGYTFSGGLLYKNVGDDVRLIAPRAMQSQLIRRAHENGHFSISKTELLVKKDYWFVNLRSKVEKVVRNCIDCILAERKQGKQDGLLHSIEKGNVPLDSYHIDHLGPLPSTKKNYRHIFLVVDAFSKFVWFYATRSTTASEVLDRLKKQAAIFGNPRRIVSDRGTAFTSNDFKEYCKQQSIEHVLITTGVPRANGQVERINRTLIPLLSKLAAPKPEEWYKYLELAQQYLNMTPSRSTGFAPSNLLFGVRVRLKDDTRIKDLIDSELAEIFQEERDDLRHQAKQNILKIQQENRKSFNKKRNKARQYKENDFVAIKRTQLGPGLKFLSKYLGPYEVTKILRNDRYVVRKIGDHEGPQQTSASADHMKPWLDDMEENCSSDEVTDS